MNDGLCVPVVFSHPLRAVTRDQTIRYFREREATLFPEFFNKLLIWSGTSVPEVAGQNKDVTDFRALLASPVLNGASLLFLEDDIEPCRNALRYMLEWKGPQGHPVMTSFYNPGRPMGLNHGFIFSQAFKLPAVMVATMRMEPFPLPHPKLQRDGIDQVVNRYLTRWGVPFYQHRSLVQHVGEESTWTKSTLRGTGRRSIDWPGPEVDALTFKWGGGR